MKHSLLILLLTTLAAHGFAQSQAAPAQEALADGELTLLHARPFVLEEAYVHTWRKDAPQVRSGYLLVLQGPIDLVQRRQVREPLLLVGAQTAERVNAPPEDAGELGQLIVVVPAPLDPRGRVALDPWKTPVYFGSARLPEDVDEPVLQAELARARTLGKRPPLRPRATASARALARPAPALRLRDRDELDLELATLVEAYSPTEVDLVRGLRVPVFRR